LAIIRTQNICFKVGIEALAVVCRKSILCLRAALGSLRPIACASTWLMPRRALQFSMF
jgi:hypothetical protein